MLFDTHAHYDDRRFDKDRDALLSSMEAAGVSLIVNAASSASAKDGADSSRDCIELAERYPFIYASVGVHPHEAKEVTDAVLEELVQLSRHPRVVAIGETGLDYHYDFSPRDVQKRRFIEQLELARSAKLPVIIHEREAARDTLEIVRNYRDLTGVLHCFSGSWETAKILLDMGWYLSFTGVITFSNARKSLEVVEKMPPDRIMIETDSPYLSPEPERGGRNSSHKLHHVARKVAEVRGISFEEAAALTMENGRRFFTI